MDSNHWIGIQLNCLCFSAVQVHSTGSRHKWNNTTTTTTTKANRDDYEQLSSKRNFSNGTSSKNEKLKVKSGSIKNSALSLKELNVWLAVVVHVVTFNGLTCHWLGYSLRYMDTLITCPKHRQHAYSSTGHILKRETNLTIYVIFNND